MSFFTVMWLRSNDLSWSTRFAPTQLFHCILSSGHDVGCAGAPLNIVPRYSMVMGRGNVAMHHEKLGVNFGASDPRADGQAIPEQLPF